MTASKDQIKKDIFGFLKGNGILTLAVAENDRPWVCTGYYGLDGEMNLYFVTDPGNRHGRIVAKNPKVAFNIFDSHQKITEQKKGVQGEGTIDVVRGLVPVTRALLLWHKANPGIETKITIKDILKKITDTKIYKVRPTYLKFFNQELYGEEEYGILEL